MCIAERTEADNKRTIGNGADQQNLQTTLYQEDRSWFEGSVAVDGQSIGEFEASDNQSVLLSSVATLDKSTKERNAPFPGHTYPAATVTGMPSAVKRLRTASRIWTAANWQSKPRDISRWPSSFTQFIFASTLLRRW